MNSSNTIRVKIIKQLICVKLSILSCLCSPVDKNKDYQHFCAVLYIALIHSYEQFLRGPVGLGFYACFFSCFSYWDMFLVVLGFDLFFWCVIY